MKPLATPFRFALAFACVTLLHAERVDNVLARMVPADTISLVGMRMDQLKTTPLFQKLVAQEKLSQLDDFARESGFDPRRDVRDLLFASNGKDTVLLARGSFHVKALPNTKKTNYHGFVVTTNADGHGGYCILDSTLAVAGTMAALQSALDQYKSGKPNNAAALLARARAVPEDYQLWGVTEGGSSLFSKSLPAGASNAPDLSRIFASLQNTLFEADLRGGLKGRAEGTCATAQDAKSLSDATRGMVGMARLNTPDNQPDLLRVWDGIKVEQADRKLALTVDVSQDLVDQLLKLTLPGTGHKPKAPSSN